jgi:hypothetical protein
MNGSPANFALALTAGLASARSAAGECERSPLMSSIERVGRAECEDTADPPRYGRRTPAAHGQLGACAGDVANGMAYVIDCVDLKQGQTQRCGLLSESGLQVTTTECGLGLRDCRLERTEVPNAGRAACHVQEASMELPCRRAGQQHGGADRPRAAGRSPYPSGRRTDTAWRAP